MKYLRWWGRAPRWSSSTKDFLQAPPLTDMDAVHDRGAVPLVTWEPWVWGGGVERPAYSLDRITAGDFDARILEWEHAHDVVSSTGASNVQWMWSPKVPYRGSTEMAVLCPGGNYVDVVALDGYNWGTSTAWSSWVSPQDLFVPGIAQLRTIPPGKPIQIAQTASSEAGGSKAAWNTSISYLAAQPDVMGFMWFHLRKEADWRISSSASSASAVNAALLARRS